MSFHSKEESLTGILADDKYYGYSLQRTQEPILCNLWVCLSPILSFQKK